jgi:hypothetical protein
MNNPLTRTLICALALTLTVFSANKAVAIVVMQRDMLTLSITFGTQKIETDSTHSVYKIVETTLDTADVLKLLAEDLDVTSNGKSEFPKGSYLLLTDRIYVQSLTGQTWDVSAYLQYSLAANVVLGHGTTPLNQPIPQATPNNIQYVFPDLSGITYTSLVHIHFEDANHVADFTGFANTQGASYESTGTTSISSASGSGMLDGMPALVTAHAELTDAPWSLLPL